MKKISILTAVFSCIFAASHAQQTNITTTPVYDNEKNEQLIKHVMTPKDMEKYALIDNSQAQGYPLYSEKILLTGNKKTDKSLFKIDASDFSPNPNPYDIKKVTFPKKGYLYNQ